MLIHALIDFSIEGCSNMVSKCYHVKNMLMPISDFLHVVYKNIFVYLKNTQECFTINKWFNAPFSPREYFRNNKGISFHPWTSNNNQSSNCIIHLKRFLFLKNNQCWIRSVHQKQRFYWMSTNPSASINLYFLFSHIDFFHYVINI